MHHQIWQSQPSLIWQKKYPEPSNSTVNSPNLNDVLLLTDTDKQFNFPMEFKPTNSKANLENTETSCGDEGYNVQPPDILMSTPSAFEVLAKPLTPLLSKPPPNGSHSKFLQSL